MSVCACVLCRLVFKAAWQGVLQPRNDCIKKSSVMLTDITTDYFFPSAGLLSSLQAAGLDVNKPVFWLLEGLLGA